MVKSMWMAACRRCREPRAPFATRGAQLSLQRPVPCSLPPRLSNLERPLSQTPRTLSSLARAQPRKTAAPKVVSQGIDVLKKKTEQWLEAPVGTWSSRHFVQGEYLMDGWLNVASNDGMQWATRVLRRWIQERAVQNPVVMKRPVVELLHRVLHGWNLYGANDAAAQETSEQLLLETEEACSEDGVEGGHRPGNKAYSMVFQLLAKNAEQPNTLDKAQELLERRLKNGTADLWLWQSYLNVLAKTSPYHQLAAERAESTLHEMEISPDEVCFASVLHAWAKSGRPGAAYRAQSILDSMLSSDSPVEPNVVCINTVIDAWAKSGDTDGAQRAQDLLLRLEELSRQPGKEHLQPDSVAYNTVINAWATSGKARAPQHAQRIFEQMQRLHENGNTMVRPDGSSAGAVLVAWSRSREPGAAQRAEDFLNLLEELREQGKTTVQLSSRQYTSVINAWANSRERNAAEQAERILLRMEDLSLAGRKEVAPETIAYTAAIQAWSKSSNDNAPDHALSLLRRMQGLHKAGNPNVAPNIVTFNTVISACAKHGAASQASQTVARDARWKKQR